MYSWRHLTHLDDQLTNTVKSSPNLTTKFVRIVVWLIDWTAESRLFKINTKREYSKCLLLSSLIFRISCGVRLMRLATWARLLSRHYIAASFCSVCCSVSDNYEIFWANSRNKWQRIFQRHCWLDSVLIQYTKCFAALTPQQETPIRSRLALMSSVPSGRFKTSK